MSEGAPKPATLTVRDDTEAMGRLELEPHACYEADYHIVGETSEEAGLVALRRLEAAGERAGPDQPGEGVFNGKRGPDRPSLPLETHMPGVFAIGDVKAGPVRRVASAAGEGSVATQQTRQYLRQAPIPPKDDREEVRENRGRRLDSEESRI